MPKYQNAFSKKKQVVRLLVLAGAHLGLSSVELGILFTSNAGQVDHPHLSRDDPVLFFHVFCILVKLSYQGREQVLRCLLATGVDVNTANPLNGNTGRLLHL